MESTGQGKTLAKEMPLFIFDMVNAVDREGKEAIFHLSVGIRLASRPRRHFNLDETTPL